MKILFKLSFLLAGAFVFSSAVAQESCKVSLASIAGNYDGECKKGKANGQGKAQGVDLYEGQFKDGFPSGKGVYQWENGNNYNGEWVNGKRDGQGDMTFKRSGKTDSLVTGFWKKDQFIGKHEKAYEVHSRSLQVSKTQVKYDGPSVNEITILLSNTTGNMPTLSGSVTARATLGAVNISKGAYVRLINLYDTNKQTAYKLENVSYPFRAKFTIGNQDVDVEFYEAGKFVLEIGLNN